MAVLLGQIASLLDPTFCCCASDVDKLCAIIILANVVILIKLYTAAV